MDPTASWRLRYSHPFLLGQVLPGTFRGPNHLTTRFRCVQSFLRPLILRLTEGTRWALSSPELHLWFHSPALPWPIHAVAWVNPFKQNTKTNQDDFKDPAVGVKIVRRMFSKILDLYCLNQVINWPIANGQDRVCAPSITWKAKLRPQT